MRHANNEKTEYICVNQVAGRIVRKDARLHRKGAFIKRAIPAFLSLTEKYGGREDCFNTVLALRSIAKI